MSDVIYDTEDSEINVAAGASYNINITDPHLFDMEVPIHAVTPPGGRCNCSTTWDDP
jgi:hypothetical protein